jgi:TRAP-type mannitol/chloroaromatic compound transport system permease small subunit
VNVAATGALSAALDRFSKTIGRAVSWLTLLMVIVACLIVVLRYVFAANFIWLQESLVWMHAVVLMVGAAYTLQQDAHVRVDIFYREMSECRRAWVNAFGVICFLFPLCIFFVVESWDYVYAAWSVREVSRNSGGLPFPAIPLLKSVLLLLPLTIGLQGVSLLLNSLQRIRKN